MRKFLLAFLALFFIAGCGYAPIAKVTKSVLGEAVFVDVLMSKTDPQNTVAIKDAVREGVVYRLHRSLSDKANADTQIYVSIASLSFTALTYDKFGYITSYRANLSLNFRTTLKDGRVLNIRGSGDHDFRVTRLAKSSRDTSSVISDQERYDAIANASSQAFDEFVAALAVQGFKAETK